MSTNETPLLEPALFEEVANLVAERGIRYVVETGTGPRSSGMEVARKLGLHGYTSDVYEPCVRDAHQRYPDFDVYHAESIDMLRAVCPMLHGPAFFWLDAHCPTDHSNHGATIFPLYEEMVLIRDTKPGVANDVLWLDDIAMIVDPANPMAAAWDVDLAGKRWYGDKDHTWEEYMAVFEATHDATIDRDQCILKLTPKVTNSQG